MTDILFKCGSCSQQLSATPDSVGQTCSCPRCNANVTVPLADNTFDCPNCSKELAVGNEASGKVFACPHCDEDFQIPEFERLKLSLKTDSQTQGGKRPCSKCGKLLSEIVWKDYDGLCPSCKTNQRSFTQAPQHRPCEFCRKPVDVYAVICPHCGQARSDIQELSRKREATGWTCALIGCFVGYFLGTEFDEQTGRTIGYGVGPILGFLILGHQGLYLFDKAHRNFNDGRQADKLSKKSLWAICLALLCVGLIVVGIAISRSYPDKRLVGYWGRPDGWSYYGEIGEDGHGDYLIYNPKASALGEHRYTIIEQSKNGNMIVRINYGSGGTSTDKLHVSNDGSTLVKSSDLVAKEVGFTHIGDLKLTDIETTAYRITDTTTLKHHDSNNNQASISGVHATKPRNSADNIRLESRIYERGSRYSFCPPLGWIVSNREEFDHTTYGKITSGDFYSLLTVYDTHLRGSVSEFASGLSREVKDNLPNARIKQLSDFRTDNFDDAVRFTIIADWEFGITHDYYYVFRKGEFQYVMHGHTLARDSTKTEPLFDAVARTFRID